MVVREPILGRLTQGVIFNCAQATRYAGHAAHGLVITARCDLANDKVPIVTYLPIVPLDAWLGVDGFDILIDRAGREFRGRLLNFCKQNNIATTILDSQSIESIVNVFYPVGSDKKTGKLRDQGLALAEHDRRLKEALCGGDAAFVFEAYAPIAKTILREICTHKLAGYYFIPSIYNDDNAPGYVVLMREVTSLPTEVALAVANGLDAPLAAMILTVFVSLMTWRCLWRNLSHLRSSISCRLFPYYMAASGYRTSIATIWTVFSTLSRSEAGNETLNHRAVCHR